MADPKDKYTDQNAPIDWGRFFNEGKESALAAVGGVAQSLGSIGSGAFSPDLPNPWPWAGAVDSARARLHEAMQGRAPWAILGGMAPAPLPGPHPTGAPAWWDNMGQAEREALAKRWENIPHDGLATRVEQSAPPPMLRRASDARPAQDPGGAFIGPLQDRRATVSEPYESVASTLKRNYEPTIRETRAQDIVDFNSHTGQWDPKKMGPKIQEALKRVDVPQAPVGPEDMAAQSRHADEVQKLIATPRIGSRMKTWLTEPGIRGANGGLQHFSSEVRQLNELRAGDKFVGVPQKDSPAGPAATSVGRDMIGKATDQAHQEALSMGLAGDTPGGHDWVRLPQNSATGALGGKFVHPDVAMALAEARRFDPSVFSGGMTKFLRGNMLKSGVVAPWVHEFVGELHSGTLSGGLDFMAPKQSVQSVQKATQALSAHYQNPAKSNAEVAEATALGVISPSQDSKEARAIMSRLASNSKGSANLWDFGGALGKAIQPSKMDKGGAWDVAAQSLRLAAYTNVRDSLLAQLPPDAPREMLTRAREIAARRVMASFPMPPGNGAPQTHYFNEGARTKALIAARTQGGEPALAVKLRIQQGALAGGIAAAARDAQAKSGISAERLKNPHVIPLRGKDGKLNMVDLSWLVQRLGQ